MEIIEKTLRECGCLLDGHFRLTSGRHGEQYFEKAEICANPVITADFCWEMANEVVSQFEAVGKNRIEIVVGLAPIGAILGNRIAEYLTEIYQEPVTSVFTEKDEEGEMVFKRGYAKKIPGKRALIVDDVLTTGGSVGKVKKEIERLSGQVVGVAVICQRGAVRSGDLADTPIFSLVELKMKDWSPAECPLCQELIPIINPKSR